MIFIGPKLSESSAHFVTNVIASIGGANDLVIDLKLIKDKNIIYKNISLHLKLQKEKYVIYNAYEDEDFFIDFKKKFPDLMLIAFFSDDEWRHVNYNRYIASYADYFTIAVKDNIKKYEDYGLNNHIYLQWACNPKAFYPLDLVKKYDVTFIGAPYGHRIEYIRFLVNNRVDVRVFGKGWDKVNNLKEYWGGYLSEHEMLKVISQSKINLNFLWTSREPDRTTIKGRTMELAACRGFQLSNDTDEFSNYGFENGINITTFSDKKEMLSQVRYFLANVDLCETIAQAGYDFVVKNHVWKARFSDMFSKIKKGKVANSIPKFKILVVLKEDVQHSLIRGDSRLDLDIKHWCDCSANDFFKYTGIVFLFRDSTINNETLFMMALAKHHDVSDVVIANFYFLTINNKLWIRVHDRGIKKFKSLMQLLPIECICFSPEAAIYYFVNGKVQWRDANVSLVEYPSFSITGFNILTKRFLKLFWGNYPKRKVIQDCFKSGRYFEAINIALDSMVQRKLH